MMGNVTHATIYFSGRVQGVGFRYATLQLAKEFEVTGFVQNLTDGRVLLDVEGPGEEITALVEAIEERMHGYIRKVERTQETRLASYSGFTIR
jgi:acylphosphatase